MNDFGFKWLENFKVLQKSHLSQCSSNVLIRIYWFVCTFLHYMATANRNWFDFQPSVAAGATETTTKTTTKTTASIFDSMKSLTRVPLARTGTQCVVMMMMMTTTTTTISNDNERTGPSTPAQDIQINIPSAEIKSKKKNITR